MLYGDAMITKWDKAVIVLVLMIALLSYIIFSYAIFGEHAEGIEIFVDGKEYASYSFADITEDKILRIETEQGFNILKITEKGALMTNASCPDKIDVKSGEISKSGQMIICIPNKVLVRITGKNKLNVDKVTY
ncbi:MAG: NusG domain II-containing protein [Clostridia bacterium]|nr:NusG domain II-containing protein [Clostridia bacterium]